MRPKRSDNVSFSPSGGDKQTSLGGVSRDRQDLAKINLMDETSKTEA